MMILKLIKKDLLTIDVYELTYQSSVTLHVQAWQFFMCILPSGLRRAYSVAQSDGANHILIIKRLSDGRGGSKEICDMDVGAQIEILPPMGHFLLQHTDGAKLFIGTGTGFAPLYLQMTRALELGLSWRIRFVFWVRTAKDVFYLERLEELKKNYANFDFSIYLSREKNDDFQNWYVTEYLARDAVAQFQEFYICGSPALVRDARRRLESLGVEKAKIYFEQY